MLRFGPDDGPLVIAALPLFAEANRTRAFVVAVLRTLAGRGISALLPDWPGTGESLIETRDASLSAMREAYEALADRLGADRPLYGVGIRSGCLLDGLALLHGRWHLSPQTGEVLLRELWRVREARDGTKRAYDLVDLTGGEGETLEIAGDLLSPDRMLADLVGALPFTHAEGATRIVRLAGDARPADAYLSGPPLWRRAEPGNDPGLVQSVADDIAAWIETCAG